MRNAGRLLYARFQVFGGTCVWIGDRWVLTARHGVKDWSTRSLQVDFPAHGERSYAIRAIHLPKNAKTDLALLELGERPPLKTSTRLLSTKINAGSKLQFGGYGNYGSDGEVRGTNRFHWGANVVDGADHQLGHFSMSQPTVGHPNEALPALLDSGSPVFMDTDQGQLLAGVVVRVSNRMAPNIGDRAAFTCLAGEAEWIRSIALDLAWND